MADLNPRCPTESIKDRWRQLLKQQESPNA